MNLLRLLDHCRQEVLHRGHHHHLVPRHRRFHSGAFVALRRDNLTQRRCRWTQTAVGSAKGLDAKRDLLQQLQSPTQRPTAHIELPALQHAEVLGCSSWHQDLVAAQALDLFPNPPDADQSGHRKPLLPPEPEDAQTTRFPHLSELSCATNSTHRSLDSTERLQAPASRRPPTLRADLVLGQAGSESLHSAAKTAPRGQRAPTPPHSG